MFDELMGRIAGRLTDDLSDVNVLLYPDDITRLPLPALLPDLEGLDPVDLGGDGIFDCYARVRLYCVVDPGIAGAELEVASFAARVAVLVLKEEDFGFDVVRQAEIVSVGEDSFRPDLESYLVWAVEFQVGLSLGVGVWLADPPTNVSVDSVSIGDLNHIHVDSALVDQAPATQSDTVLTE